MKPVLENGEVRMELGVALSESITIHDGNGGSKTAHTSIQEIPFGKNLVNRTQLTQQHPPPSKCPISERVLILAEIRHPTRPNDDVTSIRAIR